MGEINDAAIVSALRRQMTQAAARQVVSASNLANLDTPGYKAQEISFGDALDQRIQAGARLATTNSRHIAAASANDPAMREADLPARRDGNTVQLEREMLNMTRANGDFAAAQTALAAKFRLVRYALSEGR